MGQHLGLRGESSNGGLVTRGLGGNGTCLIPEWLGLPLVLYAVG